jgi:hypothetical protein
MGVGVGGMGVGVGGMGVGVGGMGVGVGGMGVGVGGGVAPASPPMHTWSLGTARDSQPVLQVRAQRRPLRQITSSRPRQSQFDQLEGEQSSPVSRPVEVPPPGLEAAAQ